MVPVMAHTSIAFPKQGPGLSDGIALAKLVTSPTMNQMRRAPVVKVAEEVAHRQKVAVWDRTLVVKASSGTVLCLEKWMWYSRRQERPRHVEWTGSK
jgi:hypothetical protein